MEVAGQMAEVDVDSGGMVCRHLEASSTVHRDKSVSEIASTGTVWTEAKESSIGFGQKEGNGNIHTVLRSR